MWTGKPALVGTLLLILLDMGWSFNGPINWGNGLCSMGNIQLSIMMAKINVEIDEATTTELIIPDTALVSCVNGSGADQYKLFVSWSFPSSEPVTTPKPGPSTNPTDSNTNLPKGTTQPNDEASTAKQSTKAVEATTVRSEKLLEGDSLKHAALGSKRKQTEELSSIDSAETLTTDRPPPSIAEISTTSLEESVTDGASTFTVGSTTIFSTTDDFVEDFHSQSTTTNDVTTSFEVDSVESKKLKGDIIKITPLSCPPFCDSEENSSSSRIPSDSNQLTFIITKKNSIFSVSDADLRFTLPDSPVPHTYYISWRNINLFPGPIDATHVCNVTTLPVNDHGNSELVLQHVRLTAYLPPESSEFPEKTADCNLQYEKDMVNEFCRNAEVILITIGTFVGVLLLGSLGFYAAKLYCNSKRERDVRDALP